MQTQDNQDSMESDSDPISKSNSTFDTSPTLPVRPDSASASPADAGGFDSTFSKAHPKKPPSTKRWGLLVLSLMSTTCLVSICLLFGFASLTSALLTNEQVLRSLPLINPPPVYNQIAFVGNNGHIWLVEPEGTRLRPVTTGEGQHQQPTWSQDGRHLAFVSPGALHISPTANPEPSIVFEQDGSQPFYLYWRPDSQSMTFLTRTLGRGMSMRYFDLATPTQSNLLERGSPLYWVWSPASDQLVLHVSDNDQPYLSLLDPTANSTTPENRLTLTLGEFQSPLWSPDGSRAFYVGHNQAGQNSIYQIDPQTLSQQQLITVAENSATFMILSPQGEQLAYLETNRNQPVPIGLAYLIDVETQDRRLITPRPVISMYWSPDGTKLALLTVSRGEEEPTVSTPLRVKQQAAPLTQAGLQFQWWVYDPASTQIAPLITIRPTFAFLQTIPFFDQYHHSLTFWSPDSRYLVVTTETSPEGTDEDEEEGAVIVVDTEGEASPQQIGEGTIAVWSWQ